MTERVAPPPRPEEKNKRAVYLGVHEVRRIDHWCVLLREMFPSNRFVGLVGSVLEREQWRDIDVRVVLSDKAVRRIPCSVRDLNMLLSQWGEGLTGLPIDCQVQAQSEAEDEGGKLMSPRGLREPKR